MASPTLKELFEEVTTLSARVVTLEGVAAANTARLDALDASKGQQDRDIDRMRAEAERDRWYAKYRRRR